jgi:TM2 domain-containing membrane protein YozV
VSLGLNDNLPIGALAPEPRHKSAGLAFALSLLVPGTGQLYCGKIASGGMTLAFWLLGVVLGFARISQDVTGLGVMLMLVLWVFSFLDAYFTAVEINRGQEDLLEGQNPRVAVTLNVLTAGFGYFYLGERTKGIILFVLAQVTRLAIPKLTLPLFAIQLLAAADAYRIAHRQVQESLAAQPVPPAVDAMSAAPASRLPVQVPVVLACLVVAGSLALVVIGLTLGPYFAKNRVGAGRKGRIVTGRAPIKSDPHYAVDDTPIPVVDFPTAVQDVQRVERKSVRGKGEIPRLKQDVRMLTTTLGARKVDGTDQIVARYYRAVALTMINIAHEREGEADDVPGAQMARADFDKVIGASAVLTYVSEVNDTNAEYWAGVVARNQLHDEAAAYSYWEKCAWNLHAGCMNNVASAKLTGEGGTKVDISGALDLHNSVFNSGVKYHCAGAYSALDIAAINYFTGVRRAGDDELEWTRKADGLLDKLEAAEHNRNVCERAEIEVDEFLFQLSQGHRDDNILQDALSRANDDSLSTKAIVQFISGAIDESGFDSAVRSSKSPGARCSAYFDAMWYAELRGESEAARRDYRHLVDIGKIYCGEELVYARKFKF